MTVAQQLSGPLADELLTSALQAFTSGLNAICLLTAVLSVALAELAVLCASGADRLRIEFRCAELCFESDSRTSINPDIPDGLPVAGDLTL